MKKLILFLMTLFLISSVCAQEELLLQINIFDDGSALIIGSSTINPNIQDVEYEDQSLYGYTQHLTNKKGVTWTFSLELEQDFSNNYIKIILPENSKLGPVSSDLESFVTTEEGNIVVEFIGKDKVVIEFDYELETQIEEKGFDFTYIIIIIVIVIILIISIISFLKEKRKKKIKTKTEKKKPNKKNPLKTVMSTLNEREKKIIKELLEHKKLKQKQLQHLIKIPKVSLSRHLVNLENKNLIIKKSLGKTNIIKINKNFDKKDKKE